MGRGAWRAMVCRVAESGTRLRDPAHMHRCARDPQGMVLRLWLSLGPHSTFRKLGDHMVRCAGEMSSLDLPPSSVKRVQASHLPL